MCVNSTPAVKCTMFLENNLNKALQPSWATQSPVWNSGVPWQHKLQIRKVIKGGTLRSWHPPSKAISGTCVLGRDWLRVGVEYWDRLVSHHCSQICIFHSTEPLCSVMSAISQGKPTLLLLPSLTHHGEIRIPELAAVHLHCHKSRSKLRLVFFP